MLRLISFASLCAMMISCSSGTDNKERIVANLDDFTTPEIKIEKVIQLETRNDALIGEHFRIKTTKEHFVIGDDDKIMVFNRDGSVKSVFSPKGRGPRESNHIHSFFIDEQDNIVINDTGLGKLLEFDPDGKFLSVTKIPIESNEIMLFNNRILVENEIANGQTKDGSVSILSESGKLLNNGIEVISTGNQYGTNKFQRFDDYVLYLPAHHDQIYKIDKRDSISVAYSFDFGRRWPSQKIFEKYANHDDVYALWKYIKENSLISFLFFMDSEKWLVLNYTQKDGQNNWFYNKKNGTQHLVKFDPNGSLAGYPIMCVDDNKFISMVAPGDIPTELKDMNLKTSENDNPAVVIWSVK